MSVRQWLLLPFLGSAEGPEKKHQGLGRDERKFRRDEGLIEHESAADFAGKSEEEIVQDYNAPTRWWVASTLFPLIAGTFGPLASTFNICAVAIDWRLIVNPSDSESEGTHIRDPRGLVAVNAISLAIAIVANFALLAHMTNRIRFNFAAPTVLAGWFISGFIDVALVAAAPIHLPLPADRWAAYSQAYYYAIFSGAIYILLAMMLTVTALGIWVGNFSSEFKLTLAQRSLMLQTMLLLGYVLAGGAVYSHIESWLYLDGVYFAVVTLFTIGFGDFSPQTHLGRSLFFPFAVGGIIFVGMIIGNIRTLVLESGSVKVSLRLLEKARYKAIKAGSPSDGIVKIRGVRRRDINGSTEQERRRKEFQIMREIQEVAKRNNRLFALSMSLSAFMILWFIGAVCFWQAEKATGGQNWTYFESIYFAYVAQLTIGFGDFEPQTNSAKPTFVFWAMLALPTLTVLIGAVGDAVTASVNWTIVWLGNHIPNLTNFASKLYNSKNKEQVLESAIEEIEGEKDRADDGFTEIGDVESGKAVPAGLSNSAFGQLSTEKIEDAYRPYLALRAAQMTLGHLDEDTPRKYTYEEWAWLLMLLGENEAIEDGHRRVGVPLPDGTEVATPLRQKPKQVWSWMGQESPLLSLEDGSEPKWVLKRLMQILEQDLKREGDKLVAQEVKH